jgi:D-alanyl-D-alanine carboxypeptidase/uncharacterized protein YgiM (DUF1202 family)
LRIRKRLTSLLLTLSLLTAAVPASHAETASLRLYLNGRELYMPQAPILKENRVLVPMRAYLESLGAEVSWQPPDTVSATLQNHSVQMKIGSTTAVVDGKELALDVPAQLINDRTYLPLRFLSEGLGAKVGYDGQTGSVTVATVGAPRLMVIDGPLNVRQSPSTAAPILTTVPNGTVFDVIRQEGAWTQVQMPRGRTGWVASQFTRLMDAKPVVEPFQAALAPAEAFLQIGADCLGAVPLFNERVHVPLKQTVEKLGGSVTLAPSTVAVKLGGRSLTLAPGETAATRDGQPYTLATAPILLGGQVLISARVLADALNIPLTWSDAYRTVALGPTAAGAVCNPAINANAYIIMDAATGVVLSESRSRDPFAIASTTKIMTGLLAVELGSPDQVISVSRNASGQPGTSVYLRAGEQRTLKEMLLGLFLVSGNDAATAIAEHFAGTEAAFARLMNSRAAQLGATNTLFYNASGLDDYVNPYSTARDLATIARFAMQNPEFRYYMSQSEARIPGPSGTRLLKNLNQFVLTYPGATGVKNGWTEKANHTLVASAYRDGRELLVVLLGAPTKSALYDQARALMDHGFRIASTSWLLQ